MDRSRVTIAVGRGGGGGGVVDVVAVAAVLGCGVRVRVVATVLAVRRRARRLVVGNCGGVGLFGFRASDRIGVILAIVHIQMTTCFSVTISICTV